MLLGSHKYSLYKPHKLPWALSQILPIISYILSNLGLPQKILITLLLNWATKLHYLHKKAQNHLTCKQNPKSPTKPNIILAPILHVLKFLIHGKYNYSSLKKYFSYKIYKSPCISPMVKLCIFVGKTKPKEAQLQSLAEPAQLTYKSQQLKLT